MNRSVKELQVTTKTDVFAFGVVLAELITGQRALIRDNREPKRMRSLVSVVSRPLDFYYRETKQINSKMSDTKDMTSRIRRQFQFLGDYFQRVQYLQAQN